MKIEEVKRPAIAGSQTQDTSGLSHQCSATEPQQPHNHQPSQSSMCTAQVVLNASVTHLAATQFVPSELRGRLENSFHQRRISPSGNPPSGKTPISLYFHLITSKFISFYRDAPKLQQSIVIRRVDSPIQEDIIPHLWQSRVDLIPLTAFRALSAELPLRAGLIHAAYID